MKTKIKTLYIWSLILLLSACNLPSDLATEGFTPVRAWFDSPLPGTVFAPPNPCTLVAHGASPHGIALFELSVNGSVWANIPSPDVSASLVTLPADCGVSAPGEYLLELRARDNTGQWSDIARTNIVIGKPDSFDPLLDATDERPTFTPEPLPAGTPTPTSTLGPEAFINIESISATVVYTGGTSCGPREVTFTARAVSPQGIKVVVLFYRFVAGNASDWLSVSMNPQGGGLYAQTVNVGGIFGNSSPFDQGVMQYQAVLQTDSGDTSTRTPVFANISVLACGSVPACSAHGDQSSCEANGCAWKLAPGIVPLFTCQNP